MSNAAPEDLFHPLRLERRFAEAAATDFSDRFRAIIRAKGMKAAESYAMGMLIAAVSGSRAVFDDDALVQRVLEAQMALAMPPRKSTSERRH